MNEPSEKKHFNKGGLLFTVYAWHFHYASDRGNSNLIGFQAKFFGWFS